MASWSRSRSPSCWPSPPCFWRRPSAPIPRPDDYSSDAAKPVEDFTTPHPHSMIGVVGLAVRGATVLGTEAKGQEWPCVQRKVATLTSAQFWDGPQVEGLTQWHDNASITQLIPKLSSRRVAIEDATAAIERFAGEQPAEERDQVLTLLFAGLLQRSE